MKYAIICLCSLIALAALDAELARRADERFRRANANLDDRLTSVVLDIKGPRRQGCVLEKIYFVYAYQTCFMKEGASGRSEDTFFTFVYHKPLPLHYLSGQSEGSYRFREPALGETLATIRDGVVVRERYSQ